MLDQSILDDIIRRIVEVAHPERIVLFGSAARGDMNRHSDVDLFVVKNGGDPWAVMGDIYGNLRGGGRNRGDTSPGGTLQGLSRPGNQARAAGRKGDL